MFLVFERGARRPRFALKFARVAGIHVQFDRDERGLALAAKAPGAAARHAPRWIGRMELEGRAASVETAAAGVTLTNVIEASRSQSDAHSQTEIGARWILDLGVQTAAAPAALSAERDRLTSVVLPAWERRGVPSGLVESLPPLPAVLNHGEVFEDHVIVDGSGYTVIDWEHAVEHGFPLWDLAFYATNVLAAVDRSGDPQLRDEYMVDLFAGRAPSSRVLFRWIRLYVDRMRLPVGAVGPLITLYWLHRSELSRRERVLAERAALTSVAPSWLERAAEVWMSRPELGVTWDAWRR